MAGRCSRPGGGGPGGKGAVRLERGQGQGFTQHLGAVVEEGAEVGESMAWAPRRGQPLGSPEP